MIKRYFSGRLHKKMSEKWARNIRATTDNFLTIIIEGEWVLDIRPLTYERLSDLIDCLTLSYLYYRYTVLIPVNDEYQSDVEIGIGRLDVLKR